MKAVIEALTPKNRTYLASYTNPDKDVLGSPAVMGWALDFEDVDRMINYAWRGMLVWPD